MNRGIKYSIKNYKKRSIDFEINPRFSSNAYMRHKLGFTYVLWSLNFFDEPIELTSVRTGSICVCKQDVVTL